MIRSLLCLLQPIMVDEDVSIFLERAICIAILIANILSRWTPTLKTDEVSPPNMMDFDEFCLILLIWRSNDSCGLCATRGSARERSWSNSRAAHLETPATGLACCSAIPTPRDHKNSRRLRQQSHPQSSPHDGVWNGYW